ncbi:glycosyl hydrolase family 18 protein [Crassaminicella profunda]|uniref:glycosyl hydrolase family 18 protein n=1 Tax=Crassaminicella profunda TaxID=1286698 RepID=UPI001CA65583|nr:glycosyl hydrolase family 18 protein [Crassaminicella profunda]QZY54008.1 hypothetical protein K7H06_13195 [Crassaminicella profunda]
MKKLQSIIFIFLFFFSCMFSQVHAQEEVYEEITKGEFLSTLVDMMGWQLEVHSPKTMSMSDYAKIGNKHGLSIANSVNFNEPITKEEARLMFIRSMGYDPTTRKINFSNDPFKNIQNNDNSPTQKIILKMYQKICNPIEKLHGFYAIRSYPQVEMLNSFNSVGFGWSRVEVNNENMVTLRLDKGSSFCLPSGFSEVVDKSYENHVSPNLMVYASQCHKDNDGIGIIEHILKNQNEKDNLIKQIVSNTKQVQKENEIGSFEGVIIDFEDITKETLAQPFNDFLKALKNELDQYNKKLYVTVSPKKYYKGYDYKTIGEIADGVILMAHDYYPRKANDLVIGTSEEGLSHIESPLTPIDNTYNKQFDIYNALKDITDEKTGVVNKDKIYLQISFDAIQWRKGKSNADTKVWKVHPPYDAIKKRMQTDRSNLDFFMWYDKKSENPYFNYYDEAKAIENIVWYEDTRSVLAKINLGKLFDIKNISIWRLGTIPSYSETDNEFMYLDTWQKIISQHKEK